MTTKILMGPISSCSTRVNRARRLLWNNDGHGFELDR